MFFLAIEILKHFGLIYFSIFHVYTYLRNYAVLAAKQFRWDDFDYFLNNIFVYE